MGLEMLGREAMSGRVLVDPAAIPGLNTIMILKNYIKLRERNGLRIGVLETKLHSNTDYGSGWRGGHEMHFLNIKSATCS
jgi:hypothetical protein